MTTLNNDFPLETSLILNLFKYLKVSSNTKVTPVQVNTSCDVTELVLGGVDSDLMAPVIWNRGLEPPLHRRHINLRRRSRRVGKEQVGDRCGRATPQRSVAAVQATSAPF